MRLVGDKSKRTSWEGDPVVALTSQRSVSVQSDKRRDGVCNRQAR